MAGDPWSTGAPQTQDTGPDVGDLYRLNKEVDRLNEKLSQMKDEVADARTVIEYDSERRKNALSRCVLAAFKAGADSTSRAEHEARASSEYELAIKELANAHTLAEQTLREFEVIKIRVEVLRTKLSNERSLLNLR